MVKNVVNAMTASPIELGRHPHDCCLQVNTAAPKPDKQIDLFLLSSKFSLVSGSNKAHWHFTTSSSSYPIYTCQFLGVAINIKLIP